MAIADFPAVEVSILNRAKSRGMLGSMQNGYNVLVQCAEGSDRSPQLTSLAQIIIDPYYRTFKGFSVLVEKEFISTGHQFGLRLGWKRDKEK